MVLIAALIVTFMAHAMEDPNILTLISKEGTEFNIPRHVAILGSPTLAELLSISITIEATEKKITLRYIGSKELSMIFKYLSSNAEKYDTPSPLNKPCNALLFLNKKKQLTELLDHIDSPTTFVNYIHAANFFGLPIVADMWISVYAQRFKNFPAKIKEIILSQLPSDNKEILLQECANSTLFPEYL